MLGGHRKSIIVESIVPEVECISCYCWIVLLSLFWKMTIFAVLTVLNSTANPGDCLGDEAKLPLTIAKPNLN
jgi:hypothetical protein